MAWGWVTNDIIFIFRLTVPLNAFFNCTFNSVDPNDQKKTACYDIDVEVDDPLKGQMNGFLLSTANHQEIASLDNKVRKSFIIKMWKPSGQELLNILILFYLTSYKLYA